MKGDMGNPETAMVYLDGIRKRFSGKPALEPLTLNVRRGEILGLLGHNGAGKSTTFGIMLGQVHPDGGEAFINGASVQREKARALARTGAIFETPAFYDYLSGWMNLRMFAAYSGVAARAEMEDAVRLVGLEKRIHDPVRVYSHGMRQRLALAQALVPAPEFVMLDEPTEGLDPEGIHEVRCLILQLREKHGLTVMLSSHLLSEVEQLCDRVAMLNTGRLVFEGCWREAAAADVRYRICFDERHAGESVLRAAGVQALGGDRFVLGADVAPADLLSSLVHAGARVWEFARLQPTLEEFYLERSR